MRTVLALILAALVTSAVAQPAPQAPAAAPDPNCLPETRRNTPGATLSDKLAESRGVICPPGVDPAMTQKPTSGGTIKVVPPPGSPGGDPNVQPK
jgi:hypothetical protein